MESRKSNQPAGSDLATQPPRKLSAKEILADIREGMSDRDFEQKYRLTPDGRENLFKKLIAKGLMTEAELHWRSKLLKSQEGSGNVPAPHAITIHAPASPHDTDEKPRTPTENASAPVSKTDLILAQFRDGSWVEDKKILFLLLVVAAPLGLYGLWKTSRFQVVTKAILAVIAAALVIILPHIAIPLWVSVSVLALGYVLWRYLKGAKQPVKPVSASPLTHQGTMGIPGQPKPGTHVAQSNDPVSAEEIEEAIKKMAKARRDMFGIAGDVGILGIGAAGGGIAAVAVAAFFGATSIWGVTTAGKWLGLSVHGSTPWTWIIGCAIVGAILAFSVSRFIESGAAAGERRKRNIDELRKEVGKRQKEAEKSTVDKAKFDNIAESLTMLLSNGKITPEESDGLIAGIKNGTISYEFAFASVEEYLKE